ncbi:MAG: patatin-like phospholipase family protein [Proteobacteria bacterium]|nr:patatin-like phospholipase family protein [Pseudomonadota bacterium]MBU1389951.1 patatin-like phospholipase family protein [Pseudomonadota bacterium]MBU1542550.1 patatin-like phospholipase family protein [Pseudomonadota bacterium]MBU2430947.1 patatin-like phospholipase family protein [Pseudomonadota bacterium]MBU2481690.1 patatin-like phospholipase family protein [Pseudomonadota bacterium]
MFDNISIRAGSSAIKIIQDEGLDISRVKVLAGASGSAKFLVLTGIDRVLMSMFAGRKDPLYLLGTSIGAFRMAAFCQKDPIRAIDTLEREYILQQYALRPSKAQILQGTWKIIDSYIDDRQIDEILNHPFMRISFLSNQCKGMLKSDHLLLQYIALGLAAGVNLMSRKGLKFFFDRALFCSPGSLPPFSGMDEFPMKIHTLNRENFKAALLSSGSIPVAMPKVSNISGVPGVFRDGGIIDYHLDIPFLPDDTDQFVLYPHFYETVTPGWFDKRMNRKPRPDHMKNVILVAPSRNFVQSLPLGKIPDRKDFYLFKGKDRERMMHWKKAVEHSRRLGEEFFEAVQSGKIRKMVQMF